MLQKRSFFSEYENEVDNECKNQQRVITAKELLNRKSNRCGNCLLEMFLCSYYRISTNQDLNLWDFHIYCYVNY